MNTGMPCENLEIETVMWQQPKKDPKVNSKSTWIWTHWAGIKESHLGDFVQEMLQNSLVKIIPCHGS